QVFPLVTKVTFLGFTVWTVYLAFEPYLRRRLPHLLVGWARILDGRVKDPQVGRNVLLGLTLGALAALAVHLANGIPTWIPVLHQTALPSFRTFADGRMAPLASVVNVVGAGILRGFTAVFALFLCALVLKKGWAQFLLLAALYT